MARKLVSYLQSTYYKNNALTNSANLYLITEILLPGLNSQAEIVAGSRGIELPVDGLGDQEYISIQEAKNLVLDYLVQVKGIKGPDQEKLNKIKSEEEFSNYAFGLVTSKVQNPDKLLTAARIENVAALRAKKLTEATAATANYDPGKVYDDYSKMYFELLKYANTGIVPQKLIQEILPRGSTNASEMMLRKQFASIIAANLHHLHAAGSTGTSNAQRDYAVSQELSKIIRNSYRESSDLLNFVGDEKTSRNIRELTNNLAATTKASFTLEEYEQTRNLAATGLSDYLLNESELRDKIVQAFPTMSTADRDKVATTILKETTITAAQQLSYTELVARASNKLGLAASTRQTIETTLSDLGLDTSIEYLQHEKSQLLNTYGLTRGEWKLVQEGYNPALFIGSEHDVTKTKKLLFDKQSSLLLAYNTKNNTTFTSIFDAYHEEVKKPANQIDTSFVIDARRLNGDITYYQNLSPAELSRIGRARFGRQIHDFRSRIYETRAKLLDKWIEIEDTITGKKLLHNTLDGWDKIAEHVTIPGTSIPLFRIAPWLAARWDEWKKVSTAKWILEGGSKYKGLKIVFEPIRPVINWGLKYYELGGYTASGATRVFATAQWGKLVKWSLAKTGLSSVGKYAGVQAGRTAIRFLIKIGGKSLAKFGAKAIGAIATSGTIIGTVIFVGSIIIDLVSAGWNFLKKFFKDGKFRETVVGWGLAITAFFATLKIGKFFSGAFLGLGIFVGGLFTLTLSSLLLSLVIIGSLTFFNIINYSDLESTVRLDVNIGLDSGVGQFIGNVLCEGGDSGGNQKAKTAACIVEILSKCGINPLTASNANGSSWQCVLASTLAQSAIAELQRSATSYSVLQCVGFIVAIDVATGGAGSGFGNANSLGSSPPSGYRFAAGVGSCSPGDFFVDTSGAWGHTGVFLGVSGPTIKCMDANGGGPGVVRGSESCTWLTSKVAGCLKKN